MMRDVPEFSYLKSFEEIFRTLGKERPEKGLTPDRLQSLCAPYSFSEAQLKVLRATLKEMGFRIE